MGRVGTTFATALAALVLAALIGIGAGSSEAAATAAPANDDPPEISGDARQGETLTASSGSWSGDTPMTFAYRWQRCDSSGAACSNISGATAQTYVAAAADVGKTLRVEVTATNGDGQATALSDATAVVAPPGSAPSNTTLPAVSGTADVGQVLSASNGSWSGSTPMTFAYRWLRCDDKGNDCQTLAADGQTYRIASADSGRTLKVRVTATNSVGSTDATSKPSAVVGSGRPTSTAAPTVSGDVQEGSTLTATAGTWTGSPTSIDYQWQRCTGVNSGCSDIRGATRNTYVLTSADNGRRMRIEVTARNARGSTVAVSQTTAPVGSTLPAGAIRLPNGLVSIPASSVSLPVRLVVDRVVFSPNPVRTRRSEFFLRVTVKDTRGYVVRDALVFARSVPLLTSTPREEKTLQDGTITLPLLPRATFPLRNGFNVQFFVRVRKEGDNVLAGVSARRLVQVRTARPR